MKKDITSDAPITPAQLADAHTASRLSISLDDAMRSPALARCLEITAGALVAGPGLLIERDSLYQQRITPPARDPSDNSPPARDIKRAAAGDEDD
ncbi:hypothetical protein H0A66_08745 [Alcaligenaceae bacterium]|nr:hypothetical protein [Alcaligenaceae bacterium]